MRRVTNGPPHAWLALILLTLGVGVGITLLSSLTWFVLLMEGLLVPALIISAAGWGSWPVTWLRLHRRPALQNVLLSTGLGFGLLTIITLILGAVGGLTQITAWLLVLAGVIAGLSRIYRRGQTLAELLASATKHDSELGNPQRTIFDHLSSVLTVLALVFPLALTLFGATLPPGMLWNDENRAYDVLEYHLQCPREYYDAGHIHFLPHNVYASFPQQVETLYLLLMHLAGGHLNAAVPAQLLHATFGILAALAVAAWAPNRRARWLTLLVVGAVPWIAYLGCLAYVENGLLFYAALAGGLLLDAVRQSAPASQAMLWPLILAAGLFAGFAGGCKYTALVLVAVALAIALVLTIRGSLIARIRAGILFTLATTAAFSPWLIRNAAFTGNPVYPFAYEWFGGAAWSVEQDQRWDITHALPTDQRDPASRLRGLFIELPASARFGGGIFLLALVGLIRTCNRQAALLSIWIVTGLAAWVVLTHMPGRFVVPLIAPLGLLAARSWPGASTDKRSRTGSAAILLIATATAAFGNYTLYRLLDDQRTWWARFGVALDQLPGATEQFAQVNEINQHVPPDGYVWLVGEARAFYIQPRYHYTVVYNRDPWLTAAHDATPAEAVAWLHTQNVTHVVFSWSEIERLREPYGFPPFVTPAWVNRLSEHGLRRVHRAADGNDVYLEIFEVQP